MYKVELDLVKEARLRDLCSCSELVERFCISKATATSYVRKIESSLSEEEYFKLANDLAIKHKNNNFLRRFRSKDKEKERKDAIKSWAINSGKVDAILKLTAIKERITSLQDTRSFSKGIVAEYFVKYQLLRRGFVLAEPVGIVEALDIVVKGRSSRKMYRCEVKSSCNGNPIGITKGFKTIDNKSNKRAYSAVDDIDFFFLVDLDAELIAVVPFSELNGKSSIILAPKSHFWEFIGRFDLLT